MVLGNRRVPTATCTATSSSSAAATVGPGRRPQPGPAAPQGDRRPDRQGPRDQNTTHRRHDPRPPRGVPAPDRQGPRRRISTSASPEPRAAGTIPIGIGMCAFRIASTLLKASRQRQRRIALVLDVRGRGLMCAFSLPSSAQRDELIRRLWDRRVIMLASGPNSVRFRPALTVSREEIDAAVAAPGRRLRHGSPSRPRTPCGSRPSRPTLARYVGGPKVPHVLPGAKLRVAGDERAVGPDVADVGGEGRDIAELGLELARRVRAVAAEDRPAFLPCSRNWLASVFAADAVCVAKITTLMLLETLVTIEEKSRLRVGDGLTGDLDAPWPGSRGSCQTQAPSSNRPAESITITSFAFRYDVTNLTMLADWMVSLGITRKNVGYFPLCEVSAGRGPRNRRERVAPVEDAARDHGLTRRSPR